MKSFHYINRYQKHTGQQCSSPFSASVLEAWYFARLSAELPCSSTALTDCSFQSASEKTRGWGEPRKIAAVEEVTTTRLTEELNKELKTKIFVKNIAETYPYLSALCRIPTVPFTAGSINSGFNNQ